MELQKPDYYAGAQRPTGVWFFTLYALIFAGIAPLAVAIVVLLSGNQGLFSMSLVFSILLNASIIYYAFRTWQGNDRARKIFLVLVTANYAFIGLNNLYLLVTGQVTAADDQIRLFGRVLRGVLYPAVFLWYFNRPTVKDFFDAK